MTELRSAMMLHNIGGWSGAPGYFECIIELDEAYSRCCEGCESVYRLQPSLTRACASSE